MADEKILTDEIIDDANLENVAGGTLKEFVEDGLKLRDLGKFSWQGRGYTVTQLANAFRKVGKELGLDILYDDWDTKPNIYKIDGKKVSRDEFWSVIEEGLAANKN